MTTSTLRKILLLGGTSEASRLARALAAENLPAVFSYAGRTERPIEQPLPTRIGGFGGIEGLRNYLRENAISHIVDATHPFAAQMSLHAAAAVAGLPVSLYRLERPAWQASPGDRWIEVDDHAAAATELRRMTDEGAVKGKAELLRVFLSIGRNSLHEYGGVEGLHVLLRLVDEAPADLFGFSHGDCIIARGPFAFADELALLRDQKIDVLVSKNSGGEGAVAKLQAARELGLPVIMIRRPELPKVPCFATAEAMLQELLHSTRLGE